MLLRGLTGTNAESVIGQLEEMCCHQGGAKTAKVVAQALAAMLEADLGSRSEIVSILINLSLSRFLTKAQRTKFKITSEPISSEDGHQNQSGPLKVNTVGNSVGKVNSVGCKMFCEYATKNGVLHGSFVAYWHIGVKAQEGAYVQGKREGHWRLYHPRGWLEHEGDFRDDMKEGVWTTYESFGKKLREESFVKNKLEGPFRSYYFNGSRKEEGQYRAGKKDGVWREWHFSGIRKRVSSFVKGKERPPIEAWDESGDPIAPTS